MDYSYSTVIKTLVEGSPVLGLVIAIVTGLGYLGVKGRWQLLASLLLGSTLSTGYMIASLGLPVAFGGWFFLVCNALAAGFSPSLLYETIKKVTNHGTPR